MKQILSILFLFQLFTLEAQESISNKSDKSTQKLIQPKEIAIENNIEKDSIFLKKLEVLHTDLKKIDKHVHSKSNFKDYLPILVALLAGLLALFQVKANIISSARIEWTQNLRKVVSQYLSEIIFLNYNLREVLKLYNENKKQEAKNLYDKQADSVKKVNEYGNQVKLFLNNKKETEHFELQKSIEKYYEKATHGKYSKEIDELDKMEKQIISKSQEILKQSWEDAKTFKLSDIFKFGW